jgi:hypothetical protein
LRVRKRDGESPLVDLVDLVGVGGGVSTSDSLT